MDIIDTHTSDAEKKTDAAKIETVALNDNTEETKVDGTCTEAMVGLIEDKSSNTTTVFSGEKQTLENNQDLNEANLHYEDGICIYTEPESKCQFVWDDLKQEWVPRNNPTFSDKDYEYDGKTYFYTDKETDLKYTWVDEKNEWKAADIKVETDPEKPKIEDEAEENENDDLKNPKEITKQDMTKGQYGFENNTHTYTDPSDGSKYIWDKEKNAWFPKVDDDFLAQYQMNYGFVDTNESEKTGTLSTCKKEDPPPPSEADVLKRKAPQEPAWFEVGEETTKVYVSGLPLDITESEFIDVMQKCGLVMRDLDSGKMKIKIYLDPDTSLPKGDALCTYIKKESVDLALNLLDGYDVRGHRITVERAKFTMKGDAYNPNLKPKKKRKKDKEKLKKIQEKLFDWRPDKMRGERSKHEKIIIVKNLFDPAMFNKDVKLILEYQQDLRDECLKCGSVKKVTIYDRHPEGVAQINFKEVEAADACVQLLNGRWFGQRKITAETWDGKTKYKISETDEQIKARLAKWEKFLVTGEAEKDQNKTVEKEIESEKKTEDEIENVLKHKEHENDTKMDSDIESSKCVELQSDFDDNTRSSVGSDYETDEETKKT